MLEQNVSLEAIYKNRITQVAMGNAESVILNVRNTSGKTLTLYVVVPGLFPLQKVVVRLHRRLHKTFYAIVKRAQAWLDAFKKLFAPAPTPLLLLPATVSAPSSTQQMLAKAVAAIPERGATRQFTHVQQQVRAELGLDKTPVSTTPATYSYADKSADPYTDRSRDRWETARLNSGNVSGGKRRTALLPL